MTDRFFEIDPQISPTENLFYYLQDLENAYAEDYGDIDDATIELVRECERIAQDLLESVRRFQPQGQISTIAFAEQLIPFTEKNRSVFLKNEIASTKIELVLLHETAGRIHQFKERLVEIVGVVRTLSFDGFTQRYLEEMSRLYLDGHDMAVYVTARAALEESLKEIIEHEHLEDELRKFSNQSDSRYLPSLEYMIRFACHGDRLIPRALESQATSIRTRGNWAVHQRERLAEAEENFSPLQAIKSLAAILKPLSRWKS